MPKHLSALFGNPSGCSLNMIFERIFRPHSYHQNQQTGMRSESMWENKKKPLKDQNFQGFWWRLRDSIADFALGAKSYGDSQFLNWLL